ncbi:hypothetical protein D0868_04777 [Hortaea werneckii]|uniref:N-acetyltransferase domain-containing protein n=2 Tax=Hortaea werneckii TaxID=91943 RepID=A0A3M6Z0D1_HORWE|nr:hypothetical protein KC330_g8466 [Hortaea werneckii]RMY08471.1 hypothetical protein D0868_04777 [Hortaea werneckii]
MADPTKPSVTLATVDDIPAILTMIKELAAYEHAEDKVEATEESLLRTLTFAPSPAGATQPHTNPGYAKTLLLRLPTTPSSSNPSDTPAAIAGMAMYFNNYSTWRSKPGVYLEDLYVRPQYRKRGYGKMLIQALAQECCRIGGARLDWTCLRWNTPSLEFYDSLGAKRQEDWVGLRVDGRDLEDLALGRTKVLRDGV